MKKLKINIFIFIIVFCIFLSFYFIYIINKKALPVFSNYVENSKAYPYGIILFFEFRSKLDFDNFRFMMSSEDYYNIYFGNASSDKDVRMVYNEFKFVETNKLLLDEDTELSDDIKNQIYPQPINAEGSRDTFFGRIRPDYENKGAFNMWVVSDNLLKGAAWNTVKNAEYLVKMGLI